MHELGLYSDSLGGKNMINNKKILIGLVALFGLGSIVESLAQTANESANTEESNILETWKFTGELSAGARLFFEDPLYYGQADHAFPIVEGRLSASRTWNDGKHRLMIEGYGFLHVMDYVRGMEDYLKALDTYISDTDTCT